MHIGGDGVRKLATGSFAFAGGIFLGKNFLDYEWLLIAGISAGLLCFAGLLFYGNRRLRIMLICLFFALGLFWCKFYDDIFVAHAGEFSEERQSVTAIVTDYPSAGTTRGFRVNASLIVDNGPNIGVRLYYYNEVTLVPGDVIEFTAKFRQTVGDDDNERIDALSARGAFLTGSVSGDITVIDHTGRLRFFPLRFSYALAQKIVEIYPANVADFMQALLVGHRSALYANASLSGALSASGIIHVVSISGMHVAFLMSFLAMIIKNKRMFAIIGIPFLILFMAMAGFTPSVSRAGIMQIFLICAPIFKRERDSITSLSAALFLLLSLNPYSINSVGLQLSFSATLGIILITPRINGGVSEALRESKLYKKKIPKFFITFITSGLATTFGALALTIPLTAFHFGYVSLISPITNLLTLWMVSLIFPIGLLCAVIGMIFTPLGAILAVPISFGAAYVIYIARTLATVPYSIVYTSNTSIMFWLGYIYIIFIALPLLKARPKQYIVPACITAIFMFLIILLTPTIIGTDETSITVLDVGQGLSVVIISNEYTIVVDCGSISGESAGAITHEYLLERGISGVDLMILTHFHADHVNGVEFLLSRINIAALAIADPDGSFLADDIIDLARRQGTDIIYVTQSLIVQFGELEITLFPPVGFGDENERGITILTTGAIDSIITGDMNSSSERTLLRTFYIPPVDVLVVGHHGSRHSTSIELLDALTPKIAIISSGRNSFGHPSDEVLARLNQRLIAIYRTDQLGHVRVGAG